MKKKSAAKEDAGFGVVLVTCASSQEAKTLATGLVEKHLAACVNMVPGVDSLFWWQGKVDRAQEALLIAKTRRDKFQALERYIKAHHSYDVPEMVFLPIATGHGPYLNWVADSLK